MEPLLLPPAENNGVCAETAPPAMSAGKSRRSRQYLSTAVYILLSAAACIVVGWILFKPRLPVQPDSRDPIKADGTAASRPQVVPMPAPPADARTLPEPSVIAEAPVLSPAATPAPAPPVMPALPAKTSELLHLQVNLDYQAISPGSIDGTVGAQTREAIRTFQLKENLPVTGIIDEQTRARLSGLPLSFASHVVTQLELDSLQPVPGTWLEKSQRRRLGYETILEMLGEKSHTHPNLLKKLNPGISWTNLPAGSVLTIPATGPRKASVKAAFLKIELTNKLLEAFDAQTNLLAHFPCSVARYVEKRPMGQLSVQSVVSNPTYLFDPRNFPEVAEAKRLGRRLVIPAGPNNPVGTVWIGLSKPGYGIHGTPRPEDVGKAESHGCFRLANWNAEYLLQMVSPGTPVIVEP